MKQRNGLAHSCPTCGRLREDHWPPGAHDCPVPKSVIERLREFRAEHGRRWKSILCEFWFQGRDADDHELRLARNMIGPAALYKITRGGCQTPSLRPSARAGISGAPTDPLAIQRLTMTVRRNSPNL